MMEVSVEATKMASPPVALAAVLLERAREEMEMERGEGVVVEGEEEEEGEEVGAMVMNRAPPRPAVSSAFLC